MQVYVLLPPIIIRACLSELPSSFQRGMLEAQTNTNFSCSSWKVEKPKKAKFIWKARKTKFYELVLAF